MKAVFWFLIGVIELLAPNDCAAQIQRDTIYWQTSGHMQEIVDFDTIRMGMCGHYSEYDAQGNIMVSGTYSLQDSLKCKDCFEQNYDGTYSPYSFSQHNELRVGEWVYYHANGEVKARGQFSDYVHEFRGTAIKYIAEDTPNNIYSSIDYLKEGDWNYYDETGQNVKTVNYHEGVVVFVTERF